ncbi:MAG TPA: AAA family ATPase, partial [bacterium]|nr:AAA family ATPase [bacterium]
VVTTDGAVLHPWGGVTGGSDDPLAAGPVVRRGRREELAAAITGLAASVETARLRHMETRERLERLESARSEAQSKAHEAQSHLAAAKRTLQESERRLAELRTSMEQLAKRAESQAGQVAQAETQRLTLQESLAGIAEGLSGIGSTAQLEEEVRRLREDTARTKEAEHAAQLRARELEGRVQELERSLTRSTEEAARVASELEVIAGEAAELHAKLKQVVADLPAFREAEATAAAALEASRTEESRLRRELGEAQHAVSSARSDLVGLEGDLAQALGERESLQIRLARAEADVELLGKQFREDPWFAEQFPGMAEDFAALLSHADWKAFVTPLASSAQLKRELSEIDAELAALGQVNTLADRDYSHYEERQRNLRSQREDLMAAVSDLEQSLKEIEQKSKLALEEVYALTRANFQRVFSELFPGGEARLEWTDPDNILESGLDIHVHFPGKGERHLMQFSGGERTLIAIAFLFAVLQAKPPTFVILDEVEAALDDVNVEKFLHLVDLYKDTFQFVVITHNKLTMEHAPELYGVTMKRGGTSQVVSVRVQDWIAAYGEGTEQGAGPAKALAGVG